MSNDFEEKLKEGNVWEELLKEKLAKVLFTESVKRIEYSDGEYEAELQKTGIDGIINRKVVTFDVKARKHWCYKHNDILIETVSVVENDILGWFYTSKADFVAYVWENEDRTDLIDGYLIFIQDIDLKVWFEVHHERFIEKEAESNNHQWHTLNRVVPIDEFPDGTILQFNPTINLQSQKIDLLEHLK